VALSFSLSLSPPFLSLSPFPLSHTLHIFLSLSLPLVKCLSVGTRVRVSFLLRLALLRLASSLLSVSTSASLRRRDDGKHVRRQIKSVLGDAARGGDNRRRKGVRENVEHFERLFVRFHDACE